MERGEPGTNRPEWQISTTDPEKAEKYKQKLAEVLDPELGFNVLQLGMIRDIWTDGDVTNIKMLLTTPFCPYGPAMIEQVRSKAEEVHAGVHKVELAMEQWDFSMMEDGLGAGWGLY